MSLIIFSGLYLASLVFLLGWSGVLIKQRINDPDKYAELPMFKLPVIAGVILVQFLVVASVSDGALDSFIYRDSINYALMTIAGLYLINNIRLLIKQDKLTDPNKLAVAKRAKLMSELFFNISLVVLYAVDPFYVIVHQLS